MSRYICITLRVNHVILLYIANSVREKLCFVRDDKEDAKRAATDVSEQVVFPLNQDYVCSS